MEKIITVFGHSKFYNDSDELINQIKNDIINKVENEGFNTIYIGGYGKFDWFMARIVKDLKKSYPSLKSYLVLAYPNPKWDEFDKRLIKDYFNDHFYPDISPIMPRYAILKRNRWMIDHAEYIIFYVNCRWGGASKALEYAKRKKKPFKNYGFL